MIKEKIECHKLALAVPEMSELEYSELKESIAENGQREPGIMLDGQILDGRHRYRACEELDLPFAYRPYDQKRDGLIPEIVVLDANIRRRHLSPAQKAVIGAELAEQIKVEKARLKKQKSTSPRGEVGKYSSVIAAEKVGASPRSVQRAEKLKKDDPEAFEDVKSGKVDLNNAVKKVKINKARGDSDRQGMIDTLGELDDKEFVRALRDGIVLKKAKELEDFVALDNAKQREVKGMIVRGWTTAKALRYLDTEITSESLIKDLIFRAIDTPGKSHFTTIVNGWEVSVTKTT